MKFPGIPGICIATVSMLLARLTLCRLANATKSQAHPISARIAAKRLGISRPALAEHIRRGLVPADFETDAGLFFDPTSFRELKEAIGRNRQGNRRALMTTTV